MLGEAEVAQRIGAGEIQVSYGFIGDVWQSPAAIVDTSDPTRPATTTFEQNFFASRLSLTLGPLVRSHQYSWAKGRRRFRGTWGVFDLRETGNKMTLRPKESITFNAVEHIRLGPKVAAIMVPRLTHATAGLVLATSYIDPYWDGLPVMNLTNTGQAPFTLHLGEKIATTFFFDVEGNPLPPTFQQNFAQKSHHYGLTWDRIFQGSDPFPSRKSPTKRRIDLVDSSAGEFVKRYGRALLAIGIPISAVAAGLIYFGGVRSDIESIPQVKEDVAKARAGASSSGTSVVTVSAGETRGERRISVPHASGEDPIALAVASSPQDGQHVEAEVAGSSRDSLDLVLVVKTMEPTDTDQPVEVRWIVN